LWRGGVEKGWNLVVAGWGGLGKGRFEITGLEYGFWNIGINGIGLERDELKWSEKTIVGVRIDVATEREIGWMGSKGRECGIMAMVVGGGGWATGSGVVAGVTAE
jgi:hypothetical protein